MNAYRWDDLRVGLCHSFSVVLTSGMLAAFTEISGDTNPLHIDAEFAQRGGYPSPVVYGMLTSAFYSQLIGVHLPGKFALLQGIDIHFSAPAYVNDTLNVAGEITFRSEAYKRLEVSAKIRNAENKLISKALVRVGLREE